MKKFLQTITSGLVLSFLFTTLSFAQLESVKTGNSESINLNDPKVEAWIHWDDGINNNAIGVGSEMTWYGAIRFEPTDISSYDGMEVTKVRVYISYMPSNASVLVLQGADAANLTELANQEFIPVADSWIEIELETAVLIDASLELWVVIEIGDPGAGVFPLGCDAGTSADGKSNLVSFDFVDWALLTGYGLQGDWNIQALVEGEGEIYNVTFLVDMTPAVADGFSPIEHTVFITGDFTGWAEPGTAGSIEMEQVVTKSKEIILFETFADGFPTGWLSVDDDGDGFEWTVIDYNSYDGDDAAIMSASYDNTDGPLTPDNWLITSVIEGVTEDYILSYWVVAQDQAWAAETYAVFVSTAGTDLADFTTEIHKETLTAGAWKEVVLSLGAFAGEDIYIAFRHFESTDWYQIVIDAITVEEYVAPAVIHYTATVAIPEGDIAYKYFSDAIGDGWDGGEWVGDPNRTATISADVELPMDTWGVKPGISVPVVKENEFAVYPNPASDYINIVSGSQINSLRVFDLSGRLVFSQKYNATQVVVNVNDFTTGLYIMQIATSEGIQNVKFSVLK
jgi:hypothetical protein